MKDFTPANELVQNLMAKGYSPEDAADEVASELMAHLLYEMTDKEFDREFDSLSEKLYLAAVGAE